uniref:Uncharacterized protein n=1 Tax=Zea mays TaxID=4577 RepID=A0A804PRR2_MAIZE
MAADGDVRKSGDAGGGLGNSYLFCLTARQPWNRFSRRIQARNRRLCSPPAPTHVRAFAPQGPVPLAQPARPTHRGGPPRSSLPNGRRAESFADDLKRDGAL